MIIIASGIKKIGFSSARRNIQIDFINNNNVSNNVIHLLKFQMIVYLHGTLFHG